MGDPMLDLGETTGTQCIIETKRGREGGGIPVTLNPNMIPLRLPFVFFFLYQLQQMHMAGQTGPLFLSWLVET